MEQPKTEIKKRGRKSQQKIEFTTATCSNAYF